MFTGIIEEVGEVAAIRHAAESSVITISCRRVLEDAKIGDSIAVNGVCLTVASFTTGQFTADVMPETVKATAIQSLVRGSSVNLERAMAANGRFGGHFVSGHIDGTGEILSRQRKSNAILVEIETDPSLLRYLMIKGSVAIDGTSLTVFDVTERSFTISLIPTTQVDSIIGTKKVGGLVNIECDMLAKYMEHLLTQKTEIQPQSKGITAESLAANGFF